MPRPYLALLAIALLSPFAASSEDETFAPTLVAAESAGEGMALVTWLPGPERADSYRVYGYNEPSGLVLLLDTANTPGALSATVPGGYSSYAVSGVRQEIESRIVFAGIPDLRLDCIYIWTDPPDVIVKCRPVKVRALP